jgi:hypothetical protein
MATTENSRSSGFGDGRRPCAHGHPIAKVEIAWPTALIKISFLAHDNVFSILEFSAKFSLWDMKKTQATQEIFHSSTPRYSVFRLDETTDLALLIICPEHRSYKCRISCKCIASSCFARIRIKESSAKSEWETRSSLTDFHICNLILHLSLIQCSWKTFLAYLL